MKAKLFDERGEVEFTAKDVKEITIEFGDYSILIVWSNGECDRAEYITI